MATRRPSPADPPPPAPPPSKKETRPVLPAGVRTIAGVNALPEGSAPEVAKTLEAFVLFLAAVNSKREAALRTEFRARVGVTATPEIDADVAAALAEDRVREAEFTRFAVERLRRDLPAAYQSGRPAVKRVLAREERYTQQRNRMSVARVAAAVDRSALRRESPTGAWWVLGHARDHTAACRFMAGGDVAGSARFWPWQVLDRVHPPRHGGCASFLRSYSWGLQRGLYKRGSVMDVADAIRAAAHVVMEAEEGERLAREIEGPALFEALLSYGAVQDADREPFLSAYVIV